MTSGGILATSCMSGCWPGLERQGKGGRGERERGKEGGSQREEKNKCVEEGGGFGKSAYVYRLTLRRGKGFR